jgi:diguanylate cyclase (GGDEF)-like protein
MFYERATLECARAKRLGTPTAVLLIDLDGFKLLNDTLGHEVGDGALQTVARVLDDGRQTDLAARLGGDEFAILMPETESQHAGAAVDRIIQAVRRALHARGWEITFSVGIATFKPPLPSIDEMVRQADAAMYAVKRTSKDGVRSVHGARLAG